MTNYLEELLDNANALLEQVQRLGRSGTGPDWEDAALEGVTRRFAGREPGKETRRTLEEKRKTAQGKTASGGGEREEGAVLKAGEAPEPPQRVQTPLEEREKELPLLEQIERLERALAAPGVAEAGSGAGPRSAVWSGWDQSRQRVPHGTAGQERAPGYAAVLGEQEQWYGLDRLEWSGTGGEQVWAEQADRVFRRDSRRYDGGFCLY